MENSNKQIKFGAIISYITVFLNIIIQLIYLPWMINTIGKSNYALYTLAISFVNIFLMDFGLGQAASRFLAKYRADNDKEKEKQFISTIIKLYLIIDLIIFIILLIIFFFLNNIYQGLTVEEIAIYKKLYVIVALYSIISFPFMPQSGILESHEKFIQLKLCGLGQKLLAVILTVIGLIYGMDVTVLVAANIISGIIFIIVKLVITHPILPYKIVRKTDKNLLKDIFSFSIWVTISAIMSRFIFNLAPTILGMISNSNEIAMFSPASSIEGYFFTFAAAINGLFLARVSKYIHNNEDTTIQELMVKVGKYQMFALGLIFIGFLCIGKNFIIQWIGHEFEGAWKCTLIILIPDLITYTQQIANTTIVARNMVKYKAISSILMAVTCVLLSFILGRQLGAFGSCIAIALGYLVDVVFMNFIYFKKLKFDMIKFYKLCYLPYIIPFALTIVIGYVLCNNVINISGWTGLILKALILVLLYIILVYTIALNKTEKYNIKKRILKKG